MTGASTRRDAAARLRRRVDIVAWFLSLNRSAEPDGDTLVPRVDASCAGGLWWSPLSQAGVQADPDEGAENHEGEEHGADQQSRRAGLQGDAQREAADAGGVVADQVGQRRGQVDAQAHEGADHDELPRRVVAVAADAPAAVR